MPVVWAVPAFLAGAVVSLASVSTLAAAVISIRRPPVP
jgi:hypothetical protein